MQIHELNAYNGNIDSGAYLAIDNGSDTGKISANGLLADVKNDISQLDNDLNARIDNIIAGGDAPSEAEIIDARLGGNGFVYPSLGESIRGQYDQIRDYVDFATSVNLIKFTNGKYIDLSVDPVDTDTLTTSALYCCAVLTCNAGDKFNINLKGGVKPRAYAFLDNSKNVLEVASSEAVVNREIVAPNDTAYIVLNGAIAYDPVAYKGISLTEKLEEVSSEFTRSRAVPTIKNKFYYYPQNYVETETLVYSNSFGTTDLIDVSGFEKITYSGLTNVGTNPYSVWFDSNQRPISTFKQAVGVNTIDVPTGAAYVSFSILSTNVITDPLIVVRETEASLITPLNELKQEVENLENEAGSSAAEKMAWSWWVTNRCVDERGVLYFGFVTEDAYIGVGMRYPGGKILTKKLAKTTSKDDHNAPAVNLLSDGTVLVTSCKGHGENNTRFVFLSNEKNTINCDFTDKSFNLTLSPGFTIGTTYAQTFVDSNDVIRTIYRYYCNNGNDGKTVWAMLESSDSGDTWTNYVFAYTGAYCLVSDTTSDNIKNILICNNPVTSVNPIYGGYVDFSTKKVYKDDGTLIMTMVEVPVDGDVSGMGLPAENAYTLLVNNEMNVGIRHRLLTAAKTPYGNHIFLWAKSTDNTYVNYKYFRYLAGVNLEIGESGRPMFLYSSYLGGADFGIDENTIIYCKNIDDSVDGAHVIHRVIIDQGVIVKDEIINASSMVLSRPFRYDGNRYMVMIGHYYDDSTIADPGSGFVAWKFDAMFGE